MDKKVVQKEEKSEVTITIVRVEKHRERILRKAGGSSPGTDTNYAVCTVKTQREYSVQDRVVPRPIESEIHQQTISHVTGDSHTSLPPKDTRGPTQNGAFYPEIRPGVIQNEEEGKYVIK